MRVCASAFYPNNITNNVMFVFESVHKKHDSCFMCVS